MNGSGAFSPSALLGALSGASAGLLACTLLPRIPESWLRERFDPPAEPLSPRRRLRSLFALLGAAAGYVGASAPLIFLLFQIAASDAYRKIVPDQHLLALLLVGFVRLFAAASGGSGPPAVPFGAALLTALACALFSGALPFLSALPALFGKASPLGLGDVKLFAVLGFLLGTQPSARFPAFSAFVFRFSVLPDAFTASLSFLAYAFLLNGAFTAVLLAFKKCKTTDTVPMAPAVCLAFLFLAL